MPAHSSPPLLRRLTAVFSLASLSVLISVPAIAQMRANSQTIRELAANPLQTQSQLSATPGINVVAQAGVRNIADELDIASDAFSTLSSVVRRAGLTNALASGGPYTIFAPTDEAFGALPPGTVQSLLEPRNRSRLTRILSYHVVPGNFDTFDLIPGRTVQLRTLAGVPLTVRVTDASEVYVNGNKVILADIPATNGVIHGISAVLLP